MRKKLYYRMRGGLGVPGKWSEVNTMGEVFEELDRFDSILTVELATENYISIKEKCDEVKE
jgi:hypothetical protein